MQFVNFKAKTVQDAIMEASIHFGVASDEIEYEVVQNESKGLFGIFNTKEAIIKARVKEEKDIDLSQLEPNVEENHLTKETSQVFNEIEDKDHTIIYCSDGKVNTEQEEIFTTKNRTTPICCR